MMIRICHEHETESEKKSSMKRWVHYALVDKSDAFFPLNMQPFSPLNSDVLGFFSPCPFGSRV